MIAAFLAAQIARKKRAYKQQEKEKEKALKNEKILKNGSTESKTSSSKKVKIDKLGLLKRYMQLLKTTMLAFFLSTCIHIGIVAGYYGLFLWLNPDDPGKKKFYTSTTVTKGINLGGKIIGGGGVQTNHHKSYFFHLIKEYYKNVSNLFFIQFSLVYLIILALLKFFPEREKLREDTVAAFNLSSETTTSNKTKSTKSKTKRDIRKTTLLTKRIKRLSAKEKEEDDEKVEESNEEEENNEINDDKSNHEETDINTKKEN